MNLKERKEKIKQLRAEADAKNAEAFDLIKNCLHKIVHQEPDEFGYGFAECEGCDTQFGWYCPDSPDHVCHYFTENSNVELMTGELIISPPHKYETYDCCLYCGHPGERK